MSELSIEITTVCSFDCYFCSIRKREKATLPTDVFKRVVDEALELGYDSFMLTPNNGDIFCDPEVYEKLQYLKDRKVSYFFVTNLHLANPDKLLGVILPDTRIYVSVYGRSDDEFEFLTGKPKSFRHKVLNNIEKLSDQVELLQRTAQYIIDCDSQKPSEEIIDNKICARTYDHSVLSNGDVSLCECGLYNPHLIVGNIMKSTLKDVFTSNTYRDMMKHLIKNGMKNDVCKRCNGFVLGDLNKQVVRNLRL